MKTLLNCALLALTASLTGGPAFADDGEDVDAAAARSAGLATAGARDELQLDSSRITGNRELPRVMVIVPWKRSAPGALAGRPLNSLMDEVLTPVDREVFVRRLKYYDGLRSASESAAKP